MLRRQWALDERGLLLHQLLLGRWAAIRGRLVLQGWTLLGDGQSLLLLLQVMRELLLLRVYPQRGWALWQGLAARPHTGGRHAAIRLLLLVLLLVLLLGRWLLLLLLRQQRQPCGRRPTWKPLRPAQHWRRACWPGGPQGRRPTWKPLRPAQHWRWACWPGGPHGWRPTRHPLRPAQHWRRACWPGGAQGWRPTRRPLRRTKGLLEPLRGAAMRWHRCSCRSAIGRRALLLPLVLWQACPPLLHTLILLSPYQHSIAS